MWKRKCRGVEKWRHAPAPSTLAMASSVRAMRQADGFRRTTMLQGRMQVQ